MEPGWRAQLSEKSMGKVFHYRLRGRADECDSLGHMNNAVYIRHLQQATLDALGAMDADYASWNVRTLAVEYHAPARYGDKLDIVTWVIETDASHIVCGYKVGRSADVAPVASAQIEWDYRGVATRKPGRVPERFLALPKGNIPTALDLYELDNGTYPTTEQGLRALRVEPSSSPRPRKWSGPYLKREPLDPWKNPYQYQNPGSQNSDGYDLYSFGPDGQESGDDDITNWGTTNEASR